MSRATRDSAAVRALLARVDSRSTGKLTVGAGAVEVAVHLLRGDVVAATAADDDRQCVRMLLSTGVITSSQADEYDVMIESGEDVFSALLVHGQAFDDVLSGRFRQNLCDYLSSVSGPRFYEQRGVFVANIQMGHDTRRLLDELCAQCDMARLVDVDNLVIRGPTEPIDALARKVAAQVGDAPRTISSLLHDLPLEPTRARVLVGQLLTSGVLEPPGEFDLPGEEMTIALPPTHSDEVPTLVVAPPPPLPVHLLEPTIVPREAPFGYDSDTYDPDDALGDDDIEGDPVGYEPVGQERAGSARSGYDFGGAPVDEVGVAAGDSDETDNDLADGDTADGDDATGDDATGDDATSDDSMGDDSELWFQDEERPDAEVGRPLDPVSTFEEEESPARPPLQRFVRKPPVDEEEEEEEDEDDARTEQVDRRTLSSLLWSNSAGTGSGSGTTPGGSSPRAAPPTTQPTPHGSGFSPSGTGPSRGSPLPPPSRMASPPPSPIRGATPTGPTARPPAFSPGPRPTTGPSTQPSTYPPAPSRVSSTPTGRTPPPAPTAGAPRSLTDWLNRTDTVDEDELDFFEDHDLVSRGGEADGQFRTDRANLEKVEIGSSDPESVEILEALEAPPVKYGAPVLSQVDAAAKVEVANEVLALVAQAFDETEGAGRGRAVMQLLVDGVPSQFAALLHDLKVAEGGELPEDQVLRNLNARPATEHRQLLNSSLVDIIERALSSAADELPEEAFDEVFGAVAGYRQRLGL